MHHFTMILIATVFILVGGCTKKADAPARSVAPEVTVDAAKLPIRWLRFIGPNDDFNLVLNGQRGCLRRGGENVDWVEVPPDRVNALIEDFYGIPGIDSFRDGKADGRQTALQVILVLDEAEGRYSEQTVHYAIPTDLIVAGSPLHRWVKNMESFNNQAYSKHAAPPDRDKPPK